MGDRGQVNIKDVGVWLYTHWGASELPEAVKRALAKRWRWDDPEYLSRIIFDEMTAGQQGSETGFGINSKGPHGDERRIIEINCDKKTVVVINHGEPKENTFEEFIKEPPE